jgi:hypothetical protein
MKLIGALKAAKKTAPFYSAVDEALAAIKRPKGTGAEFYTELTKQAGVKKAEIADRKLEQAFKAKGKMTKEEAQQVLADNPPPNLKEKFYDESTAIDEADIREAVARDMFDMPFEDITNGQEYRRVMDEVYRRMKDDLGTKYGQYKTPDGENYREILLKIPEVFTVNETNRLLKLDADRRRGGLNPKELQEFEALQNKKKTSPKPYYTGHWSDDPNVLAHMRVQDRKGPNGEKILHVEEIQSDWHQAGRKKGYGPQLEEQYRAYYTTPDGQQVDIGFGKTPEEVERMTQAAGWNSMPVKIETEKTVKKIGEGVPDAPFKKNWHELAMKRLLNYAAENGYDSIAITPGAEQAKRYDLSKQVDELLYKQNPDGTYQLSAQAQGRGNMMGDAIPANKLEDYVGKEVAQRIVDNAGTERNLGGSGSVSQPKDVWGSLSGEGLQVGGEGMKGFYDKMLPDYLNNYGKTYGAQVEMNSVPVSTRDPQSTSWGAGMPGDHPFMTVQDLNEPFDGMVELMRRNADTGEETLVGRMLRADSERQIAQELRKLDTVNQIKLHNFPITPEMRESIKTKGLPLYQQVGIPTAGAGAASQMLEPEEEQGLATGGFVNTAKSAIKQAHLAKLAQMREQMAPRAEAVKALIARDQNRYLADVAPNSLTNAEIESEIKRMAAKAPMVMTPSALTELKKIVQQEKGGYGARRVERAADEVPNLEKMYTLDALKERFLGDNAKALMTMSPADFEKFASELQGKTSVGPKAAESAKQGDISKYTVPTSEYVKHLERIAMFDSVPYLNLAKEEVGLPLLPYISGHEGRHRSRALAGRGEKKNMIGITPTMDLREGLPRRSQEEFIEAMKKELELSGGLVLPQSEPMLGGRPPIILPDVYAKGGAVKQKVKTAKSGKVRMTENRDTMFMELSNKKLKRK